MAGMSRAILLMCRPMTPVGRAQVSRLSTLSQTQLRNITVLNQSQSVFCRKSLASTNWTQLRTYIRPHYYNNKSSLSNALREQRNPFKQLSRRIDNLDPDKVKIALVGTNVAIFLLWQYAVGCYKSYGDPHWLNFMFKHFMNSAEGLREGRWHVLLTSVFSHNSLDHLGLNMLILWSMAEGVMQAVGVSRFLLLYGGAGVVASLVAVGYRTYLRPILEKGSRHVEPRVRGSLGASGSIMGITTFFACAFPKATFYVFFVIPMPAAAVVGLFAAYDIYRATTLNSGLVDSAAHLGGIAYGAGYWFLRVKPLLRAGRWRF